MLSYPPECMYPSLASTLKFYWSDTLVIPQKENANVKKKKNLKFLRGTTCAGSLYVVFESGYLTTAAVGSASLRLCSALYNL